jgi:hypothetical protein
MTDASRRHTAERGDRRRALANVAAYGVMVAVNALANALPLFGVTTGAVSDSLPNLFVPAGATFAIWGPIYLLLGAFVVAGAADAWRPADRRAGFVTRVGPFFVLSSAANAGWILAWHARLFPLSLLLMLALLGSLIAAYRRLGTGRTPAAATERWSVRLPFSVYLGWITVATIANVTAVLVWAGFTPVPVASTVAVIALAVAVGVAMLVRHGDAAFAAVGAWALAGIVLKRAQAPEVVWPVVVAAAAGAVLLIAGAVVAIARGRGGRGTQA